MDPISTALALAQFAPQIVRWVTGSEKAEQAANTVVSMAKVVTGKTEADEAVAAIKADPALALQFQQAVMQTEADMDKAYLADRQDARKRDVEYVKAGRWNWRADFLATLSVAGLVLCVWFIARDAEMPERAVNAIMFVAGVLAAAVRDVYGYEFGSSRGSREKNDLLQRRL